MTERIDLTDEYVTEKWREIVGDDEEKSHLDRSKAHFDAWMKAKGNTLPTVEPEADNRSTVQQPLKFRWVQDKETTVNESVLLIFLASFCAISCLMIWVGNSPVFWMGNASVCGVLASRSIVPKIKKWWRDDG